jgi:hypothetical protein
MNYKELADLWRSQRDQTLAIDNDKVIQVVRDEHRREERRLVWLNIQEVVPAMLLFFIFGWCGLFMETGTWAFLTAALLCLGVGLFLVASTIRQRVRASAFGDSVKEQLRRAVAQVTHREWLYRNILWWYLLPLVLGWAALLFRILFGLVYEYQKGLMDELPTYVLVSGLVFVIVYIAACFAFFAWAYRANRRIAVKRYGPRREQLEEMLHEIDSGEERRSTT